MGRIACIDLGTVTCRLAVADVADGRVVRLQKQSTIVNLGEGLTATGVISEAAQQRVITCVDGYLREAREMGASSICCTMTSAARDARNADELVGAFEQRGLRAQVIPGEVEGSLTLLGVCQDFPGRLILVADNGGGSTELALGQLNETGLDVRAVRSVDVGCRRLTERFLQAGDPPSADEINAARAFAAEPFEQAVAELRLREAGAERLVVTGGTVTSIVAIMAKLVPYDSEFVHLHELTLSQVEDVLALLAKLKVADRAKLPGLQPKRAAVMLGGCIAVSELMRATGFDRLTVSESDLLYGLSLAVDAACEDDPSPVSWTPELSSLL